MSALDSLLAEHDATYQCRHCWNRVHANGKSKRASSADFHRDSAKPSHRTARLKEKKP
jgi:hypothetical protein